MSFVPLDQRRFYKSRGDGLGRNVKKFHVLPLAMLLVEIPPFLVVEPIEQAVTISKLVDQRVKLL